MHVFNVVACHVDDNLTSILPQSAEKITSVAVLFARPRLILERPCQFGFQPNALCNLEHYIFSVEEKVFMPHQQSRFIRIIVVAYPLAPIITERRVRFVYFPSRLLIGHMNWICLVLNIGSPQSIYWTKNVWAMIRLSTPNGVISFLALRNESVEPPQNAQQRVRTQVEIPR